MFFENENVELLELLSQVKEVEAAEAAADVEAAQSMRSQTLPSRVALQGNTPTISADGGTPVSMMMMSTSAACGTLAGSPSACGGLTNYKTLLINEGAVHQDPTVLLSGLFAGSTIMKMDKKLGTTGGVGEMTIPTNSSSPTPMNTTQDVNHNNNNNKNSIKNNKNMVINDIAEVFRSRDGLSTPIAAAAPTTSTAIAAAIRGITSPMTASELLLEQAQTTTMAATLQPGIPAMFPQRSSTNNNTSSSNNNSSTTIMVPTGTSKGTYTLSQSRVVTKSTSPLDATTSSAMNLSRAATLATQGTAEEEMLASLVLAGQQQQLQLQPQHRFSPITGSTYQCSTPPTICKTGSGYARNQDSVSGMKPQQQQSLMSAFGAASATRLSGEGGGGVSPFTRLGVDTAANTMATTPSRQALFGQGGSGGGADSSFVLPPQQQQPSCGFSIPSPPRGARPHVTVGMEGVTAPKPTFFSTSPQQGHHQPQQQKELYVPRFLRSPVSFASNNTGGGGGGKQIISDGMSNRNIRGGGSATGNFNNNNNDNNNTSNNNISNYITGNQKPLGIAGSGAPTAAAAAARDYPVPSQRPAQGSALASITKMAMTGTHANPITMTATGIDKEHAYRSNSTGSGIAVSSARPLSGFQRSSNMPTPHGGGGAGNVSLSGGAGGCRTPANSNNGNNNNTRGGSQHNTPAHPNQQRSSPLVTGGGVTVSSVMAMLTSDDASLTGMIKGSTGDVAQAAAATTGTSTNNGPTLRRLSPHANPPGGSGGATVASAAAPTCLLSMKVLSMCRDQHGCRVLQAVLEREAGVGDGVYLGASPNHNSNNSGNMSNTASPVTMVMTAEMRERMKSAAYEAHFISSVAIQRIIAAVQPDLAHIMSDAYGNFLVQKLFEVAPDSVRHRLLLHSTLNDSLGEVACSAHGTFAVQRLIETIRNEEEEVIVFAALQKKLLELLTDVNGGHVLYKMLAYIKQHYYTLNNSNGISAPTGGPSRTSYSPFTTASTDVFMSNASTQQRTVKSTAVLLSKVKFLYEGLLNNLIPICTHKHGCCVVQKCVDFFSQVSPQSGSEEDGGLADMSATVDPSSRGTTNLFSGFVRGLLDHVLNLSVHPYGNYVIAHAVEVCYARGSPLLVDLIASHMQLHLVPLCTDKFASNVVERVLRYCSDRRVREICRVLMLPSSQQQQYQSVTSIPSGSSPVGRQSGASPSSFQDFSGSGCMSVPASSPLQSAGLLRIASDPYGNYVVQTLLTVAPVDELIAAPWWRNTSGSSLSNSSGSTDSRGNATSSPLMNAGNADGGGMLALLQQYLPVLREQNFGKKIETKLDLAQQRVKQFLMEQQQQQ